MKERGKFVVLEGGVGAGKSTVLAELEENFRGWDFYREPGSTPFGEKVRDAVQGNHSYDVEKYASFFAYTSARANLIMGVIIPALEKGRNVFLDRYWYSTYAYQGAEGVSKPVIWAVSMLATRGLKPNLVLHYDLLPKIGKDRKRGDANVDRYDRKAENFHQTVRRNYLQIRKFYPGIWRTIDASKPPQEVLEETLRLLKKFGMI